MLIFCFLTISGLVYLATLGQDRNAIEASIQLAKNAFIELQKNLSDLSIELAYWDQAVDNLVIKPDPAWADDNVGSYLFETYNLHSSYVLGAANQLIYSSIAGERLVDDPLKRFSGGLETLITKARSGKVTDSPVPAAGLLRDDGCIYIVSVAELTTYFTKDGEDIDHATDAVLILVKRVDKELLDSISHQYMLLNPQLQALEKNAVKAASLSIFAVDGTSLGSFVWEPHLPGTKIMLKVLMVIFALFTSCSARFLAH